MAASAPEVVRSLIVQLAAFQAVLLFASGLHKLISADRIRAAVREFAGVPKGLAPAAAMAAAAVELLAGSLLWTPSFRIAGAGLAMAIWGVYLALMLRAISQGRRTVDCGCSFGAAQRPLGTYQVVRNAVLIGSALLVTAGAAGGASGRVLGSEIIAAVALLALYGALDQVMALRPPRAGEVL